MKCWQFILSGAKEAFQVQWQDMLEDAIVPMPMKKEEGAGDFLSMWVSETLRAK